MNALRTPASAITRAASSGSKRPRGPATIGRPRYSVGMSASISPPIQAQSAGVQKTSPAAGKKLCESSKPGRWPKSARWACSTPFGSAVVPEV